MNDNNRIDVLDHGFVALRNLAGPTRRADAAFDADDTDPANAARMSFDAMDSGRSRDDDLRLAGYLMRNWHTTPFESIECWIEMKLPIFVARQFVRHRTVSLNEVSGRYVQLPAEWYIPEIVGAKPTDGAKQGQSQGLPEHVRTWFRRALQYACVDSYRTYLKAIENGVAAEHARLFLHVNHYTHWLWKQNLHNIMHFLSLRDHSHAQREAREYAAAIDTLLRQQLPRCMELYDEHRRQDRA